MNTTIFTAGETIKAIDVEPFTGKDKHNKIAPPLELGKEYPLQGVCLDKEGNQHLDVGLISKHNYITSRETGETLPNSSVGKTHWCHPSRFVRVKVEGKPSSSPFVLIRWFSSLVARAIVWIRLRK